ncbi:MAG: hypothetical protein V1782_09790 [Pseudomonadota bacterium]
MPYRTTAMAALLSLKKFPHRLLALAICLAGVNVLLGAALCVAGIYTSSAHGNSTTGVNRTGLNNATSGEDYAIGNCAHCHEQHASVEGGEPEPQGGPDRYLGMDLEENLCTHCHGLPAGNGAGGAPDDIKTDISKTGGRHYMAVSDSAHQANETQSRITGNLHVECTDCHNPHAAGKTKHTPGGETVATEISTSSPLYKATGVVPTFSTANWTAPTTYSAIQTATKEYQVCFKCHSGAVGNPATWSGTSGTGSLEWTDVGLEFSPYNMSGHPIVTGMNNYTNALQVNRGGSLYKGLYNTTDGLQWDQMLNPWSATGTQTMYCSDCHSSNSTVAGPHGSAYKWMLGGTNKAWPFTTAASNGASAGTYRSIKTLYSWDAAYQQGLGTDDGCFCWNCHPANNQGNNTHMNGNHRGAFCVDCHIRVPHGGKVSRLIAAENSVSFSNLPARYTANGQGNDSHGGTQPAIRKFTKVANWSYNASKCYADYAVPSPSCAYHNNAANGTESW